MFDPAQITAAILAGGAGSRLGGRDKGLELLAGRPLIAHAVAALRGQAGGLLICANRNVERYAQYAVVCSDAVPGFHGPLAGISAALSACRTPWLLTVPVDGPDLPANLAVHLYDAAMAERRDLAAAWDGARIQPLFALYRVTLAASAADALAHDLPVRRWQENLYRAKADFADTAAAFANLNTPEDFRNWENARHA